MERDLDGSTPKFTGVLHPSNIRNSISQPRSEQSKHPNQDTTISFEQTAQKHTTHPHDSESKAANCGLLISCGYLICELIAVFLSNFSFSNGPDARNYSFDRIVRTTNNFHKAQDEHTACKQHPNPNLTETLQTTTCLHYYLPTLA